MSLELTSMVVEAAIGVGITGIIYGLLAIHSKIKDLHDWHNREDEQGVKVWYTKNAKMEETLTKMTEILERMDRRDERARLIQNHHIEVLEKHTQTITKLVAVVELLARKDGK